MLKVCLMNDEQRVAHDKLCSMCFAFPYFERTEPYPPLDRERPYCAVDGSGAFHAGLVSHCFTASYGGEIVKLAGIGGVACDPAHRRGGAVRSIFEYMLPDLYNEGYVFSALYPFSHVFYRKFGYEHCLERRRTKIESSSLRKYSGAYKARLMVKGDDVTPLLELYARYQKTMDFAITRNAKYYEKHLEKDALKNQHFVYLVTCEDGKSAYVIGDIKHDNGNCFTIEDMAFDGREALLALLGFIKGFNEFEEIKLISSEDIDWRALIDEPYDVKDEGAARGMLRVVNVEKALKLIAPLKYNASMSLSVTDEQIPQNNGVFTVESRDGEICVYPTDTTPDLELSVQALARLISGMARYDTLLLCSDGLTVLTDNPAPERFFPVRRRHMNNFF